jgi:hypothetical protein
MAGIPADLVELQRRALCAEAVYRDRIAALYAHPVMRDARLSGRLPEIECALREAAREAAA